MTEAEICQYGEEMNAPTTTPTGGTMPTTNPTSTTTYAKLCYYCHGFLDLDDECDGCRTTREWDHVHATEWDAKGNIVRQYDKPV